MRREAVSLLAVVLQQGLVHPIECVPHLVALQADPCELVRKQSYQMLHHLDEKHHSLILPRIAEGILLSFEFQHKLGPSSCTSCTFAFA